MTKFVIYAIQAVQSFNMIYEHMHLTMVEVKNNISEGRQIDR